MRVGRYQPLIDRVTGTTFDQYLIPVEFILGD